MNFTPENFNSVLKKIGIKKMISCLFIATWLAKRI